jgi:hypothetical protein
MKEDGVEIENNGKQERSIQTMHGIITPNRTVLKPSKKRCNNQWCSRIRSRFNPPQAVSALPLVREGRFETERGAFSKRTWRRVLQERGRVAFVPCTRLPPVWR